MADNDPEATQRLKTMVELVNLWVPPVVDDRGEVPMCGRAKTDDEIAAGLPSETFEQFLARARL